MKTLSAGILALVVGGLAPSAHADVPSPAQKAWLAHTPAPPVAKPESTRGTLVRSFAATALLAGLGAAALVLRKRRVAHPMRGASVPVNVLGTTKVGPKAYAVVVSVAGQRLLLGVTDNAVAQLAVLDDPLSAETLASERAPKTRYDEPFDYGVPQGLGSDEPAPRAALAEAVTIPNTAPFRELLGRWSQQKGPAKRTPEELDSAASLIAETTRDVFVSQSSASGTRSIEGQAKGLAARLQGRGA